MHCQSTQLRYSLVTHLLISLVLSLYASLASAQEANTEPILPVMVSITPQKFLVERIGGQYVHVKVLVKPGASPHSYEPTAAQVAALSRSALFFSIGMPFEDAWLSRLRNTAPNLQICSLLQAVEPLLESAEPKEEAPEHGHDPHIWLSPRLMHAMAITVTEALSKQLPQQQPYFAERLTTFTEEIIALDKEINELFATVPEQQRVILTFHPAWEHFAHDYGLRELSIETDGKEPSAKAMLHSIKTAQEHAIHTLFAEPQFSPSAAQAIAQSVPATVMTIDPLSEDWANNLRAVAQKFKTSFMQVQP